MRRRSTSLIILVTFALLGTITLSGCPARRGSPADLDSTWLDRA